MKKIGILGGGQLGRMLIQSAIDFNLEVHILDPAINAPCRPLTPHFTQGDLLDYEVVLEFGKKCDIVTIEIEKVNVDALDALVKMGVEVYPQPSVIRLIQDKRLQKNFFKHHNFPSAEFIFVDTKADIYKHLYFLPAFQKLARDGYDGKGVVSLKNIDDVETKAFDVVSLLEKAVSMDKEISIIVARNKDGEIRSFPTVEMVFNPVYNLVDYLISPANITDEQEKETQALAKNIIQSLDMVGILAVEMFINENGQILLNELAPRPHNSGHHTIKANYTSQYEQLWRAILNLPLGNTEAHSHAGMINILGANEHRGKAIYKGVEMVFRADAFLHLYGKELTAPGRKMGHITILEKSRTALLHKINVLRDVVTVISD